MIQQTSFQAFLDLKKSGTLGKKQSSVYQAIEKLREASNLDVAYYLKWSINRVTPRTNELVKKGVVEIAKKDIDRHTGKKVIFWRIKNINHENT